MENQFRSLVYVNRIGDWSSAAGLAASLGVPGYAPPNAYSVFALSFWVSGGPSDALLPFCDPETHFGMSSPLGGSKSAIQAHILARFREAGKRLIASAFGDSQKPTTENLDPVDTARRLGAFVRENGLDGVDIDYEDTEAFKRGTGENWLALFTRELRKALPREDGFLLTHSPQSPYFIEGLYPQNAYLTVDREVGDLIDWYNVQFYNQGTTGYDNYTELYAHSGQVLPHSSVHEICEKISREKINITKPLSAKDVYNSGLVEIAALGKFAR